MQRHTFGLLRSCYFAGLSFMAVTFRDENLGVMVVGCVWVMLERCSDGPSDVYILVEKTIKACAGWMNE